MEAVVAVEAEVVSARLDQTLLAVAVVDFPLLFCRDETESVNGQVEMRFRGRRLRDGTESGNRQNRDNINRRATSGPVGRLYIGPLHAPD